LREEDNIDLMLDLNKEARDVYHNSALLY